MKRTKIILLIVFALTFSLAPLGLFTFVTAKKSVILPEAYDIGPKLRSGAFDPNVNPTFESFELPSSAPSTSGGESSVSTAAVEGDTMTIVSQNFLYGWLFFESYVCVYTTENTEIWLSTSNLNWSEGDSRLETHPITHTPEMIDHLADEFDNNIYPKDTDYFGVENFHDGDEATLDEFLWYNFGIEWDPMAYYDEAGKNWILVSNFLDENYYDPTFPSFIIGFYWSQFESWYDRNIINLDAAYWQYLLGPEGSEWISGVVVEEDDEYAYESTTAHEYQHLLHDDHLPGDPAFMDEACSMFAEQVCGYPIDYSKISWFLSTPDNSLIDWADQTGYNTLADYGSSYLWALYLTDHFGWDFMGRYVQGLDEIGDPIPDLPFGPIARLSALLPGCEDFYSVYHDWRIANLIHSDSPGGGRYNYISIDLDDYHPIRVLDVEGKKIPWTWGSSFPTITEPYTAQPDGLNLGNLELNPFSTDYLRFTDFEGFNLIHFNGDKDADYPMEWLKFHEPNASLPIHVLHDSWWSGPHYALKNVLLGGEVEIPDIESPQLNLLTYWDIEDYWDFGFVQISTDDGDTWTSLENPYTTDFAVPNCLNYMKDYLPGLTSWTAYLTGEWYTPIPISFDLSAYAGEKVLIGFRFMTDWGTEYDGWFIKEADVEGSSIMDIIHPIAHEVDFMITAVEIEEDGTVSDIKDMWIKSDRSERGLMLNYLNDGETLILIISAMHEYGTTDYKFKAKSFHWRRRNKDCTIF